MSNTSRRVARIRIEVCLGLVLAVVLLHVARAQAEEKVDARQFTRPFRLDDIFDEEELGAPTFSPDGRALAFTRRRPSSSQPTNGLLIAETRDDVWVQLAPGEPAKNLTKGAADHSGWWNPRWSPDGQYLSFLSTRGGIVNAWVWERATNKARAVSAEGIEFSDRPFADGEPGGCRWVGNRELLCLVRPEGQPATPLTGRGRAVERANAEWGKAAQGEVSAAVINSLEFRPAERRLVVIDVQSGRPRMLATVAFPERAVSVWIAPDSKTIALVERDFSRYPILYRFRMGFPARVRVLRLDGSPLALARPLPENVLTTTVVWSPNGKELAFFAFDKAVINPVLLYGEEAAKEVRHDRVDSMETPARLWRVSVDDGRVEQADTGDVDLGRELLPPSFLWTASGELVFRARRLGQRATPHVDANPDWLVLDRHGKARPLLTSAAPSPATLESIEGGAAFLGLMDGDVWRIEPPLGTMRNLTAGLDPVQTLHVVDGIGQGMTVALKVGVPADDVARQTIAFHLKSASEGVREVLFNPSSGQTTPLPPEAVLESVHPATGAVAYKADNQRGVSLWRGDVSGRHGQLAAVNAHRGEIARPEQRVIQYKSLNGEPCTAHVMLPLGYTPGRRYPLIVDSDIGAQPNVLSLDGPIPITFATAGYVYMYTSSPVKSMDAAGRNNLLLVTNGILPAVDEAVAAGFADPDRVFLYGLSSFGFGVLGAITQTTRFRAAVAGYGWSDQISDSLSVGFYRRYSDIPFDAIDFGMSYSISRLPFWRNAEHHRRNSPLTYVDRVQTPVLIIQGDLDAVPIENAEMFFAALMLQRKEAQFVRYSGEGHGTKVPFNRRDEFQRMLAWFDNYGDISRDQSGAMVFDGDRVKSRGGSPPLSPEDFAKFGPTTITGRTSRNASPQEP